LLLGLARVACADCSVVDLMPAYWRAAAKAPSRQAQAFRTGLVQPFGDLYGPHGVGFSTDESLDQAILTQLAKKDSQASIKVMSRALHRDLPKYLKAFRQAFPDFRCDFTFYLLPALGNLDGAGRQVNGRPALLLGVDNLSAEFAPDAPGMRIFLDHELFHRYHSQIAGFSDDLAAEDLIWRSLWAEGLATYVSQQLNPPATLQDALFFPADLTVQVDPQLSQLVERLMAHFDDVDRQTFSQFFMSHKKPGAVPARAGYYLGALAAAKMRTGSLYQLVHLKAEQVHEPLRETLLQLH
jgi:hypothetical protein